MSAAPFRLNLPSREIYIDWLHLLNRNKGDIALRRNDIALVEVKTPEQVRLCL